MTKIDETVIAAIRASDVTQVEWAKVAGVSLEMIHKYIKGVNKLSVWRVELLMDKLGLVIAHKDDLKEKN